MKLALLLIIFVSCGLSQAALHEGNVTRTRTKLYFTDPADKQTYALSSQTPLLATYLNRLKTNDFISVEGLKNPSTQILTVKSINFVGLSDLIGHWVEADQSSCIIFNSHTDVFVTLYKNAECVTQDVEHYSYFINPTSKAWTILIAGEFDTYVGDLRLITPTELEIKLYNSDTGSILSLIRLRKKLP